MAKDRARDPRRVAKLDEANKMLNVPMSADYKRAHDQHFHAQGMSEGSHTTDTVDESARKEGKSTEAYLKEIMES